MEFIAQIWPIVAAVFGLGGTGAGIYLYRRSRRTEVVSAEANTANKMIDLMDKTIDKVSDRLEKEINELKTSNGKLCNRLAAIEKALKCIRLCDYRDQCPVRAELQNAADSV